METGRNGSGSVTRPTTMGAVVSCTTAPTSMRTTVLLVSGCSAVGRACMPRRLVDTHFNVSRHENAASITSRHPAVSPKLDAFSVAPLKRRVAFD